MNDKNKPTNSFEEGSNHDQKIVVAGPFGFHGVQWS